MTQNPLKKYSQRPGTFVQLPSDGNFYSEKPSLTVDNELEVRPMTASDEIRLKNPDGLMNSESLFQVIEHVAPGIQNAREIPTPDLDIIVIGMRLATYGENMDIGYKCVSCGHDDEYQVNLTSVLANAQKIDAPSQVKIGELLINIKPHSAETNTMLSNYQGELTRAARQLELAAASEKEAFNQNFAEILSRGSKLLFEIASKQIVSIELPNDEGTVTDEEFFIEWLSDLPAPEYQILRDAINAISKERIDRKFTLNCPKCSAENNVEVTFDPANFFGTSSL